MSRVHKVQEPIQAVPVCKMGFGYRISEEEVATFCVKHAIGSCNGANWMVAIGPEFPSPIEEYEMTRTDYNYDVDQSANSESDTDEDECEGYASVDGLAFYDSDGDEYDLTREGPGPL